MKEHYPDWGITKSLRQTFEEIHEAWVERQLAVSSEK
jgi:CDP-paratose 2-epimerase